MHFCKRWLAAVSLVASMTLLACGAPPTPPPPATRPTSALPAKPGGSERVSIPIDRTRVVMYECNLRAMSAAGDLAGVTARLDAIKALGCNVVWLMPIHPVGQVKSVGQLGSPYSVRDYRAVDPQYGTLQNLRSLVAAAHQRGMLVIMDWVANHTAWDNPWISAHPEYYAHDAAGNIISPPGTGWNDVAQLNYASTGLRTAMTEHMQYWVDNAGIDGFRCDAAEMVPADFWASAITSLRANSGGRPLLMLAEGGTPALAGAGFDLLYGFNLYTAFQQVFGQNAPATTLRDAFNAEDPASPTGRRAERLHYTTNHDETAFNNTPLGLFGGTNGSLAAYALASWRGGAALVYSGQEIGWPVKLPFFSLSLIDWSTGASTFAKYTEILTIRQRLPALLYGTATDYSTANTCVFVRSAPGIATRDALVLVNVRNTANVATLPAAMQGSWKNERSGGNETLGAQVGLGAYEYRVYSRPAGMQPATGGN